MELTHVGLDADDTLWHSENRFRATHDRFRALVARHVDLPDAELDARILATEQRNLDLFGYGAKAFTLSLIESAVTLTEGRIPGDEIGEIVEFGKALLQHPVELLPGVAETVERLRSDGFGLVLVTKGDLLHQESKIAASGLADHFQAIEIVSEKDPVTYRRILDRHGIDAGGFCMVGNSVRSDVLPVLEIGGRAVHVHYPHVWAHEAVDGADADPRFVTVPTIDQVPRVLAER